MIMKVTGHSKEKKMILKAFKKIFFFFKERIFSKFQIIRNFK